MSPALAERLRHHLGCLDSKAEAVAWLSPTLATQIRTEITSIRDVIAEDEQRAGCVHDAIAFGKEM